MVRAESFGYKNAWVAARVDTAQALADAMGLRNARRCDWSVGIKAAYEYPITNSVFVTLPIDGWVLCVGFPLFGAVDARPPEFGRLAVEWATTLSAEVQYFSTHRIVEAHAWARAQPSALQRAYVFVGESGEKVLDEGAPTDEERELGFAFFDPDSPEADAEEYWAREDLAHVGEEHVMALAGRWSVDPSTLEARALHVPEGLLCAFGEPLAAGAGRPATPSRDKPWWKVW
jgi:hypothetical protein